MACTLSGAGLKIAEQYEGMKNSKVFKDNLGDIGAAYRKIFESETDVSGDVKNLTCASEKVLFILCPNIA